MSCKRKHTRTIHCEMKNERMCKDCCIQGGGMGCRWWVVCW